MLVLSIYMIVIENHVEFGEIVTGIFHYFYYYMINKRHREECKERTYFANFTIEDFRIYIQFQLYWGRIGYAFILLLPLINIQDFMLNK